MAIFSYMLDRWMDLDSSSTSSESSLLLAFTARAAGCSALNRQRLELVMKLIRPIHLHVCVCVCAIGTVLALVIFLKKKE